MESVSGAGHWGSGLFISAQDRARVGLVVARDGIWRGRQVISRAYLQPLRRPCMINPQYGLMWCLNTGRQLFSSVLEDGVLALGAGENIVWIAPSLDLLAVARWIDKAHCAALLGGITAAAV